MSNKEIYDLLEEGMDEEVEEEVTPDQKIGTPFSVTRGLQKNIISMKKEDGRLYFATDTGNIYLGGPNNQLFAMGGSGSDGAGAAIYYVKTPATLVPENDKYTVFKTTFENEADRPVFNDILLNLTDGSLFRVLEEKEESYLCEILMVSGTAGPGGVVIGTTLEYASDVPATVIDGQDVQVQVIARSLLNDAGQPRDKKLVVTWRLTDIVAGDTYETGTFEALHGEITSFNLGARLRPSTTSECVMYATGMNSGKSDEMPFELTSSKMELTHVSTFSNMTAFEAKAINFSFNTVGNLDKIAVLTYDKGAQTEHYEEKKIGSKVSSCDFSIPSSKATHGYHSVTVDLYQDLGNGVKGSKVEPNLSFEIAVVDPLSQMPIIWLGDYKKEYLEYDDIQIPFLVYNPSNNITEVLFLNAGIQIGSREINTNEMKSFEIFEIVDATMEYTNNYSIKCGTGDYIAKRDIEFNVSPDTIRDMTIAKSNQLVFEFDAKGRSNNEPSSVRSTWKYQKKENRPSGLENAYASFTNFNWRNNGWMMEDRKSLLRISNGASVKFYIGDTVFAGNLNTEQSHTFDLQFKIRNIQNYSNLVKDITRYKEDEQHWLAFQNQSEFDNYDAYLRYVLGPAADDLEFSHVYKKLNLKNIVGNYSTTTGNGAVGFCLGPQDAFFSNGADTVSVNYVEDEIINLSMVYDNGSKLIYIYINGVITGIIKSGAKDAFNIGKDYIEFTSNYCDIDLYSMRIYNTALNVFDICHNYAVDYGDAKIYDQNQLAQHNDAIHEYQFIYNNMIQYNAEHPEDPLMPYIIFDTSSSSDSNLPYRKDTTITADCIFVNTVLDAAYKRGELQTYAIKDKLISSTASAAAKQTAVKNYYKHHCPSWVGYGIDMEVQGTSSEFYPRRNYKVKTKIKQSDGKKRAQIYLNKGPFEEEFNQYQQMIDNGETVPLGKEPSRQDVWYMDNYTNGTERWTMKVDYMESSGSYNAGFAGLIRNAYSKHPLEDYINEGAIDPYLKDDDGDYIDSEGNKLKESEYGLRVNALMSPLTKTMRWQDFRTSLLGFPVMAFHKRAEDDIIFIGYYRMLLDKGSDDVMGFNVDDSVTQTILDGSVSDLAECWEFATNARTFCSFKDHWNRVELSFKAPLSEGDKGFIGLNDGKVGGPLVLEHFEPRYVKNDDYLKNDENGFYNFGNLSQSDVTEMCEKLKIDNIDISDPEAKYKAQDAAINMMRHWEDACKWVYSTCLDNVCSQGEYELADDIGAVLYTPNKFYIRDAQNAEGFSLATDSYSEGTVYFNKIEETDENGENVIKYEYAYAVPSVDKIYSANKYYVKVNDAYSLSSDNNFDGTIDYYRFKSLSDSDIEKIADLLVKPADIYDANVDYYTYNSDAKYIAGGGVTGAVSYVGKISEDVFNTGKYYVPAPKTYVNTQYKYDTKEYRTAKFINELSEHFDVEYLATYFIATETFELYDSRGKNCMMASWGPLKEGGDYIWYPIFYDMDTQLGINNTGIPSFEFNVDATNAGNFSTSDSILWNNFYKFFKNSYILMKYKHMKGVTDGVTWPKLTNPPLKSVKYLEGWYTFNPEYTDMISCKGDRPLISTNLDSYWKYITITNPEGQSTGITGYYDRDTGACKVDANGTFFYALQGDRSQSRRQFLNNRLEYVDSWLNQGNYQRGGSNCIRGRVSANNPTETSDIWLQGTDGYYNDDGTKKYPFDAEHWVNLTPVRSSYVTLSDDSTAYPSQKYDGISPVKFNINSIQNGVLNSPNYPEQLLYIYGMNQMSDVGLMHNLYWREFVIDGDATKLTKLNLGYDGLVSYIDKDGKLHENVRWFNNRLNQPSIPAARQAGVSGMPLLKEVNLSNIQIQAGSGSPTLNLTSCEKLENFRATGSTLTDVQFAEGVALNTLYAPRSLATLSLDHANLLTNLITEYKAPEVKTDGTLKADPGLFIEGLFDENPDCALKKINIKGGALGYDSYKLLKQIYDMLDSNKTSGNITMTEVEWSPYVKVYEGENYSSSINYVIDNGHYGLIPYEVKDQVEFQKNILSGKVYRQILDLYIQVKEGESYNADCEYFTDNKGQNLFEGSDSQFNAAIANGLYKKNEKIFAINDSTVNMLLDFISNTNYTSASAASVPELSGIIYINNSIKWDEGRDVRDKLQAAYPNMTFFFANEITKAYSARFILVDKTTGAEGYVVQTNGSTSPSVQKISQADYANNPNLWFENPYKAYLVERDHWDFSGWSTTNSKDNLISHANSTESDQETAWGNLKAAIFDSDEFDYTFYAILNVHEYKIIFKDKDNPDYYQSIDVEYNNPLHDNVPLPVSTASTELKSRNGFRGWTMDINKAGVYKEDEVIEVMNLPKYKATRDFIFYAVYQQESVFDTITDSKYFYFDTTNYLNDEGYNVQNGYMISVNPKYKNYLSGKLTLPTKVPNNAINSSGNPVPPGGAIIKLGSFENQPGITHIFFDKNNSNEIRTIIGSAFTVSADIVGEGLNSQLEYVDFESMFKLRQIGQSAFTGAVNFKAFTFYEPLSIISNYAFQSAGSFNSKEYDLVIPGTVTSIGQQAFAYGVNFKNIYFGNSLNNSQLTYLGEGAIVNNEDAVPNIIEIHVADETSKTWWTNQINAGKISQGTYMGEDGKTYSTSYHFGDKGEIIND